MSLDPIALRLIVGVCFFALWTVFVAVMSTVWERRELRRYDKIVRCCLAGKRALVNDMIRHGYSKRDCLTLWDEAFAAQVDVETNGGARRPRRRLAADDETGDEVSR